MKTIVTGGAGFIGGNFMHFVVNTYPDEEWICLDSLTYAGNLETLAPLEGKKNYRFIKGDITDRAFIFDLFAKEKPDVVINFAAESHVDRSLGSGNLFKNQCFGYGLPDGCLQRVRYKALSSGIYRRGIRRSAVRENRPFLYRGYSYQDLFSLFFLQGKCRPFCTGLSQNLWSAGNHFPLFQQLRSLSFPGEVDSAGNFQSAEQ